MRSIIPYILHLADNALILGHRNSEWTGHGPILEQDIALSNISLDLIGQARNFYQYAAELTGKGATEDTLAYLRDNNDFKNSLLAEQKNGDWGKTILRQFLFSAYQYPLYQNLLNSADARLSAISEKSLKEVTYHLRWSSEWVIRLGKGTQESYRRINNAINELWNYTEDLIMPASYESELLNENISPDSNKIRYAWKARVEQVFGEAGIMIPENEQMITGGKEGRHTEYLQELLHEMQYMQRTYPGVEW
jgi:ring-1,2-phenylacetyl-CoA epoxidase subunit PaaC